MHNLKDFVGRLDEHREVAHVHAEVSSDQEIAEIHRRVIAADGPALFFHRVKGSPFPVVTNLFGTEKRMNLALGQEPMVFLEKLVSKVQTLFPLNRHKLFDLAKMAPRLLRTGIQEKNFSPGGNYRLANSEGEPVNLSQIPFTKSWPEDGGHFLTLPLVYTEHPEGKGHNLGVYRIQRHSADRLGIHWQIQKGGGFHYQVAEAAGEALPVNISLGGHPAMIMSAIAPLPENVGELVLASFLQGHKLKTVRYPGHPLPVVAESEFAFLGSVAPKVRFPEGPFGDHYGYYSLQHDYPVFQCHKILYAKDAIFPATVVGKPRQEDFYIGDYLQKLLSPLFPLVMPGVQDLWSYGETGFHALSSAVVKERYPREAMVSAFRILGEGQLSLTKFLLVTDTAVDLRNFKILLQHILERADFATDLYIFNHLSMDTLDYAGPEINKGSKGILLGVGEKRRSLPEQFSGDLPAFCKKAQPFCPGCLVVEGEAYAREPNLAERIAGHSAFKEFPLVVLVDDAKKTLHSTAAFLWTAFTRMEPAADMFAAKMEVRGHHIGYVYPIAIDARMKPKYPKELFCDPDIRNLVDKRWEEYFPKGMAQGSSDLGHL